ncbi:hypothetical protein [Noviherbaspirillum sedimenti]|uniref:Colicin import membrane protein n=1 Tax=Noviherbaspirillum sedimenti TaxID=2320865 RepID=A0A3A3G1V9_9BURK|nr:hypothetical protein [Noviherbaspirillum sedimenti]RJG00462.1 hypothetical protein D3878_01775 [Noviherbaspirillum sedimenti]
MDVSGFSRVLSALLLGLVLAQPALAQQDKAQQDKVLEDAPQDQPRPQASPAPSAAAHSVDAMVARYPQGAIDTDALAVQAQADVNYARSVLAAQFANAQNACHGRFFTNACIDRAKEAQRAGLAALRPVELEANAYLRQSRVDRRDRALTEQRIKAEAVAQERLQLQPENEKKAARKAEERASREQERQAGQAAPAGIVDDRVRRHEEKLQRLREEDAGKAQERARNIAAYEEKQKEAAERQKKVAEKKAQKQQKQGGNPASPAATAAGQAVTPAKP